MSRNILNDVLRNFVYNYCFGDDYEPLREQSFNAIFDLLLKNGAKINDNKGYSGCILHRIASTKYVNLCKLLIDNGADVNIKNSENQTPLDIAYLNNNEKMIELLEKFGAEKTIKFCVERNKYGKFYLKNLSNKNYQIKDVMLRDFNLTDITIEEYAYYYNYNNEKTMIEFDYKEDARNFVDSINKLLDK